MSAREAAARRTERSTRDERPSDSPQPLTPTSEVSADPDIRTVLKFALAGIFSLWAMREDIHRQAVFIAQTAVNNTLCQSAKLRTACAPLYCGALIKARMRAAVKSQTAEH